MLEQRLYELIKHTDFDNLFKKLGYTYYKNGDYNINIIGIRNLLDAKKNGNIIENIQRDKFDDAIVYTYKVNGVWVRKVAKFTTDPGLKLLKAPSNSKGTAILVPGQYRSTYKKDLHNGKYYAVCQRLAPVKVYRDNDRDSVLDMNPTKIDTGMFGINIHRASVSTISETIKGNSAGCQVFESYKDFNEFMLIVDKCIANFGNKFTYTLITTDDILTPTK